jgi:acetyl esterase/lipase
VTSLRHRILAALLPVLRGSSEVTDPERLRAEKLGEQATATSAVPRLWTRGMEVDRVEGFGFAVHDLRVAGTSPKRTLLYLHGGGFVSGLDGAHWRYVTRLARQFDLRVVLPDYPLAPSHSWRDSHEAMLRLFEQVAIESPGGVVLAGDSAGGGYALALAQQIAGRPGPQPTELVLVAPWVDLTDGTPGTIEAAARDPWLKLSRLRLFGQWWAGGDDVTRPEVSPLNGDLSRLPRALMWCGTRDLLQPQCRLLAERGASQGWDLAYVEEPGLIHVYPLLPIPEAQRAMAGLADFLA